VYEVLNKWGFCSEPYPIYFCEKVWIRYSLSSLLSLIRVNRNEVTTIFLGFGGRFCVIVVQVK
jgi:hypothetical protein